MTLPLAWNLRGSSAGAQAAGPPLFPSRQGHALPAVGTSCEKGETQRLSCWPCKALVHSNPSHKAAGQAGVLQEAETQSQGVSPNSASSSEDSRLCRRSSPSPIPLHCYHWLPGRSAPFCFPCSPAALEEAVQVTEQAEHQPSWNKCGFHLGQLNPSMVGLDHAFQGSMLDDCLSHPAKAPELLAGRKCQSHLPPSALRDAVEMSLFCQGELKTANCDVS